MKQTIDNYMNDGADYQARAVLCFLQGAEIAGANEFYLNVSRWQNCREQGYIITARSLDHSKQTNIIFFEHRNSDAICAVQWDQKSLNSLNIDNAEFGDIYKTKFDVSHRVEYGQIMAMSDWIENQLTRFYAGIES